MGFQYTLRVPIKIADCYAPPGEETKLFPQYTSYLTRDEVFEVFPSGCITHERFQYQGVHFRLQKRGNSTFLAVLDDIKPVPTFNSIRSPRSTRSNSSVMDIFQPASGIMSKPILDLKADGSDVEPSYSDNASVSSRYYVSMPSARSDRADSAFERDSSSMGGALLPHQHHSISSTVPGPVSMDGTAAAVQQAASQHHQFIENLLVARDSPVPLDRYKALFRLTTQTHKRQRELVADPTQPEAWAECYELLKQIVMVGDCLARFGTADFLERSNSSRAITNQDYASLLRRYLQLHGCVYQDAFLEVLPQQLQDDAGIVRCLLQTRCEANRLLFEQLVKHVGMENQQGGGAMVINHSTVTANPVNHLLSKPQTLVQAASNALSQLNQKSNNRLAAIGAVAALGLVVLTKGRIIPFVGRRGRSRHDSFSDEFEDGGRRRGWRGGRVRDLTTHLVMDRSGLEHRALRYVSHCQDQLRKSMKNNEVLAQDWRIGSLRLGLPWGMPHPQGYEYVDARYCNMSSFVDALEGRQVVPLAQDPMMGGGGGWAAPQQQQALQQVAYGYPVHPMGMPIIGPKEV